MVIVTSVAENSAGGIARRSRSSTTRSASFPGSSVPSAIVHECRKRGIARVAGDRLRKRQPLLRKPAAGGSAVRVLARERGVDADQRIDRDDRPVAAVHHHRTGIGDVAPHEALRPAPRPEVTLPRVAAVRCRTAEVIRLHRRDRAELRKARHVGGSQTSMCSTRQRRSRGPLSRVRGGVAVEGRPARRASPMAWVITTKPRRSSSASIAA